MKYLAELFARNRAWAARCVAADPGSSRACGASSDPTCCGSAAQTAVFPPTGSSHRGALRPPQRGQPRPGHRRQRHGRHRVRRLGARRAAHHRLRHYGAAACVLPLRATSRAPLLSGSSRCATWPTSDATSWTACRPIRPAGTGCASSTWRRRCTPWRRSEVVESALGARCAAARCTAGSMISGTASCATSRSPSAAPTRRAEARPGESDRYTSVQGGSAMKKSDRNALVALPVVVLIAALVALAGSQGGASAGGLPASSRCASPSPSSSSGRCSSRRTCCRPRRFFDLTGSHHVHHRDARLRCLLSAGHRRALASCCWPWSTVWAARLGYFLVPPHPQGGRRLAFRRDQAVVSRAF